MTIRNKILKTLGAGALIVFFTGGAQANILNNPSFEMPDASGGDQGCPTGWGCFNSVFTSSNLFDFGNQSPAANTGTQVMKMFGPFFDGGASGAFQDFTAIAGVEYTASVLAQSWDQGFPTPDPMDPSNLADVQLIFSSDGNFNDNGVGETIFETFGSPDINTLETYMAPNVWTLLSASGIAPEGTIAARIQILHIQTGGVVTGGSVFFDDASLVPVPAAVWLFGSGLLGLIGVARRRKG